MKKENKKLLNQFIDELTYFKNTWNEMGITSYNMWLWRFACVYGYIFLKNSIWQLLELAQAESITKEAKHKKFNALLKYEAQELIKNAKQKTTI